MHDEAVAGLVGFALCIVLVCAPVGLIATCSVDRDWEAAAIKHDAAHYDSKTGKFTWNNIPKVGENNGEENKKQD